MKTKPLRRYAANFIYFNPIIVPQNCFSDPWQQERKAAVKAEQREKRKQKMPKAEKKKRVKSTARGG